MTGAKAVFDETAQHYDEGRRTLLPCFDDFYGMVMKLLAFPPEAHIRVLDLGAGTGILSLMIAETTTSNSPGMASSEISACI